MGRVKFYTHELRMQIENLLQEGYTPYRIADILKISRSGLGQEITINSKDGIYKASFAKDIREKREKRRRDKLERVLTKEEILKIEEGMKKNLSRHQIKNYVGIGRNALDRYFENNEIEYPVSYENRIAALEEQIKIILELLRGKNDNFENN